jgi:hypothetical protein
MLRVKLVLLVAVLLASLGCGLVSQSIPATPNAASASTKPIESPPASQDTAVVESTATHAPTQTPSETPPPAPTDTQDAAMATMEAALGSLGGLMAAGDSSQYMNPSGAPLQSWEDVPIMPQATAGQEYPGNIYAYVADATLDQATQFYSSRAASLGLTGTPATSFGGSGDQANHGATFLSFGLTIDLTSFDNDTGHVHVVISKAP